MPTIVIIASATNNIRNRASTSWSSEVKWDPKGSQGDPICPRDGVLVKTIRTALVGSSPSKSNLPGAFFEARR
eukprot:9493305-Pyramimonas_sp.AAC.1